MKRSAILAKAVILILCCAISRLAQPASVAPETTAKSEPAAKSSFPGPVVLSVRDTNPTNRTVVASWNGATQNLAIGNRIGHWTLMEVVGGSESPIAVFEDLRKEEGRMVFANTNGVITDLQKSQEATYALEPTKLYRGHTLNEVFESATDLLGQEILAQPDDPA